jgi:small subunit ribosomal protein S20
MPIIKSAKKALRSSLKKHVYNMRRKNTMKDTIKKYKKLVTSGKTEDAVKLIPTLQKAIDKAAKSGTIKRNNASRKKSRLIKVINMRLS